MFRQKQGWEFALSLLSLFLKDRKSEERKSDLLFLRVGVEEKTSFFSTGFSPFYAQNKRANRSRPSLPKEQKERFALLKE